MLIGFVGALAIVQAPASSTESAGGDCRTATVTKPDGTREMRRFCRGSDGAFAPAGTRGLPPAPIPSRAEVTYKGSYTATVSRAAPPLRRLDLRSVMRSTGTSQAMQGEMVIMLRFQGAAITGTISGTGGVRSTRVTGMVRDGVCRLISEREGTVHEGSCGRSGFTGRIRLADDRTTVNGRFETRTTSVVDVAEREQREADRRAQAADAARREADDKRRRVAELEARANAGDIEAMWAVGYTYEHGEDVAVDYVKALSYYRRASAKGYGPAYSALGGMYLNGSGVEASKPRAFENFLACANAPDVKDMRGTRTYCMRVAAVMSYEGIGVLRNEATAVRLFRACAAREDEACINWMNEHNVR